MNSTHALGLVSLIYVVISTASAATPGDCAQNAATWIQKQTSLGDANESYDPCLFATEAKAKALAHTLNAKAELLPLPGAGITKALSAWVLNFGPGSNGQNLVMNAGLVARLYATLGELTRAKIDEELKRVGAGPYAQNATNGTVAFSGTPATPNAVVVPGGPAAPISPTAGTTPPGPHSASNTLPPNTTGVAGVIPAGGFYALTTANGDRAPTACTFQGPCTVGSRVGAGATALKDVETFCSSNRDKDTQFLPNLASALAGGAVCEVYNYPYDFLGVRYCSLKCTYNGQDVPAFNARDLNTWVTGQKEIALNALKGQVENHCDRVAADESDQLWHNCNCIPNYQARQLMGSHQYEVSCLGVGRAPASDGSPAGLIAITPESCPTGQERYQGQCKPICGDNQQRLVDGSCRTLPKCKRYVANPFGKSCAEWE